MSDSEAVSSYLVSYQSGIKYAVYLSVCLRVSYGGLSLVNAFDKRPSLSLGLHALEYHHFQYPRPFLPVLLRLR